MLQSTSRQHKLIRIAAWIAALDCLAVALIFSLSQAAIPGNTFADLWPIPALYFFELAVIAVLTISVAPGLIATSEDYQQHFPWIATGIMITFVILGAWSIGFFLVPALLALMLMAVLGEARNLQYEPSNQFAYLLLSLFQGIQILIFI